MPFVKIISPKNSSTYLLLILGQFQLLLEELIDLNTKSKLQFFLIVFGVNILLNLKYVDRAAPPHSFIHVEDFSSMFDLAKMLEYLSKNETAYREYFWWTQYYQLRNNWDNHLEGMCKLCKILNQVQNDQVITKN